MALIPTFANGLALLASAGLAAARIAAAAGTSSAGANATGSTAEADEAQTPVRDDALSRLAGIRSGRATFDEVAPPEHASPVSAAPGSRLQDGLDLLDNRIAEVRRWLSLPHLPGTLAARGLSVADVESQVRHQFALVRRMLAREAATGVAVFPLVPSAHRLFVLAMRDADMLQFMRSVAMEDIVPPVPVPATAGMPDAAAATANPAPAARVQETPPAAAAAGPTNLALRAGALQALQDFQTNYHWLMPQVAQRQLAPLWRLMRGEVHFASARQMALTMPCVAQPDGALPPLRSAEPLGELPRMRPRQAHIKTQPAVVAPGTEPHTVRYSTDGKTWHDIPGYTDEVVEAAKLRMWRNVMTAAQKVYQHALEFGLWQ
ncbi:hypothetical protein GN316_13985 [Xylophilus sp. Kf1]|nr:hypothetical protein [Xylophilus sp. Kf1]